MGKVETAIQRLKLGSEMSLKYYQKPLMITYSGGKDSQVLADLAMKAKIPMEIVNSHTTADAPPTVKHIREQFKQWEMDGFNCTIHYPTYKGQSTSMWALIPQKMIPPTRLARYCCAVLKETTGNGRMIATGVRWAESYNRKNDRGIFESMPNKKKNKIILNNDNDDRRQLFENCKLKAKRTVNPIIDWSNDEIWDYAREEHLCMNPLYAWGWKRVGCVGCPMASNMRYAEFEAFPKYQGMYLSAFDRMLKARKASGKDDQNGTGTWIDARAVFHWWMEDGVLPGQIEMDDLDLEDEDS